jgi:hypothetical protein
VNTITPKVLAVLALLVAACTAEEPATACKACDQAAALVSLGRTDLAWGRFDAAIEHCAGAVEKQPGNDEARYCLTVAHVAHLGGGVESLATMIAPAFAPGPRTQAAGYRRLLDARSMIDTYFAAILDDIRAADGQIEALAGREGVSFQIDKVPVRIDIKGLAAALNGTQDGGDVPPFLEFDLGGTWDQSDVLLLGTLFNAVLAAADYGLAHDFRLSGLPDEFSEAAIARMLLENPALLAFSTELGAQDGLYGSATRKGLRGDLIAVTSYLSGRTYALPGTAGANAGLRAAIAASATAAKSDAVIKWTDDNGDGCPEALEVKLLKQLAGQLGGFLGPIEVGISPTTCAAFFEFAAAARDNLEAKGAPVSPRALLEGLRADVGGDLGIPQLADKPVPDLVRLDAGAFVRAPVPVRDLLPYFFEDRFFDVIDNPGFLYEEEVSLFGGFERYFYSFSAHDWDFDAARGHFLDLPAGPFAALGAPPQALADDGVDPDGDLLVLYYVGWQSPSFGGLLELNPAALGGTGGFAPATLQTLNDATARVARYYCIELVNPSYADYYPDRYEMWPFKAACP